MLKKLAQGHGASMFRARLQHMPTFSPHKGTIPSQGSLQKHSQECPQAEPLGVRPLLLTAALRRSHSVPHFGLKTHP